MVETIGEHISELTRAHVITVMYLGGFGEGVRAGVLAKRRQPVMGPAKGEKQPWAVGWRDGWWFELGRVEHDEDDTAGVGPEGDQKPSDAALRDMPED